MLVSWVSVKVVFDGNRNLLRHGAPIANRHVFDAFPQVQWEDKVKAMLVHMCKYTTFIHIVKLEVPC
jgi:hypothetical protein